MVAACMRAADHMYGKVARAMASGSCPKFLACDYTAIKASCMPIVLRLLKRAIGQQCIPCTLVVLYVSDSLLQILRIALTQLQDGADNQLVGSV